jgi:hypothetical protein
VAPGETSSPEQRRAALARAEAAVWAWYLEWSQIARVAVTQRASLRELGLLSVRRGEDDEAASGDCARARWPSERRKPSRFADRGYLPPS